MSNSVTNQKLTRQINHLMQHLPKKEELSGIRNGSSYYRKINDETYINEFKKSHKHLNGLKDKYELTLEQVSFVNEAQLLLANNVKDAFARKAPPPANMHDFLDMFKT